MNDDGRLSIDGALVLTDAAACALFFFHDGTLLLVTHDRLIGTLLVADQADLLRIPGNASGFVDMGDTHLEETFFFKGKISDRFSWADLPAEIAEFFTITDTGHKPRCIKTC